MRSIGYSKEKNYRKVPKFSNARKLKCKHSKIQTKEFYHAVIPINDATGKGKEEQSDLGLHRLP